MRTFFAIIISFVLCFSIFSARSFAEETGTSVGKYAPPVELAELSGKIVTLESMRGKVVLLNFWSTLCSPCTAEMPSLNRLYNALKEKGLRVLSVAIDSTDQPVREFVSKNEIAFTVLLDKDKEVFFDDYAGPSLPATYLIDRNGVIIEKFSGPRVWDSPEIKGRLLQLLQKR